MGKARGKDPVRYKQGLVLTTDNDLVRMHGNMTPLSYKLTTYFLLKAAMEGKYDNIQVSAAEMIHILGVTEKSLKKNVVAEARKIMKTIIEVKSKDNPDRWEGMTIIPHMIYENGVATATINPAAEPYLNFKKFAGNFTKTSYMQFLACGTSYYAMRLARVCDSWANAGYVYYSIDEWRLLLGATGSSYKTVAQFKRRVLNPAIKIVNFNMGFNIRPIEIKEGRKTTHIKIIIESKPALIEGTSHDKIPEKSLEKSPEKKIHEVSSNAIIENKDEVVVENKVARKGSCRKKAKKAGESGIDISTLSTEQTKTFKRMVDVYNLAATIAYEAIKKYDVVYCRKQMEYVRKRIRDGIIDKDNAGGYLRRALENGYAQAYESAEAAQKAEIEEKKDKELWDKQAKEFFHGAPGEKGSTPMEQTSLFGEKPAKEETPYERDYRLWEEKLGKVRTELFQLVKEKQCDFAIINEGVEEFKKMYPPPKEEDYKDDKDEKDDVKNLIMRIMDK